MVTEKKENLSNYEFKGTGLTSSESRWARQRFTEYKNHYHLDTFNDLQVLEQYVYRQAIQERYKKKIKELQDNKDVKEQNIIPRYVLTALNDNSNHMLMLADKLGLFIRKKEEDEYKAFQILEKKFEIWEKNHLEERKVTCPFCSEIFFLHIRTGQYQPSNLKLFKNKVLCNEHLWKCYKEGKITKEDFALILNVSQDQIDWLEAKIYNKPSR